LARKRITPRPGDIYAVPRDPGGFYFLIHITENRFGDAFGIFDGHSVHPSIDTAWAPNPISHAVYTGRALIANGRWKRAGQRVDLLELFPSAPEIYHNKADNPLNDQIGPFGSGERATGELRNLTEAEAKQLGLDRGTYRQIMLEEQLEEYLQHLLH